MTSYAIDPAVDHKLSGLVDFINAKFEQVQNISAAPTTGFNLPTVSEKPSVEPGEYSYEISETLLWRFEGSANYEIEDDLATRANIDEEVQRLINLAYAQAEQLANGYILLWRTLPQLLFEHDMFERKIRIALQARAYALGRS